MPSLVTRFHLLICGVTVAIAAVAILRVPADFAIPAHWSGGGPDWLWPRDPALVVPLALAGLLVLAFFLLGRLLPPRRLDPVRHVLEAALSLLLAVLAAGEMALLLAGLGSDVDLFRITAGLLAGVLLVLAAVFSVADRTAYGGLRLPWSLPSERAWRRAHLASAIAAVAAAVGLAWLAWSDPGPGALVIGVALALVGVPVIAALASLVLARA